MPHRPISRKVPGYGEEIEGDTVGYRIEERETGKSLVYVPDIREMTPRVLERIEGSDVLILDGTFYGNEKLIKLGISEKTSRELGHVPIMDPDGSIRDIRDLNVRSKIYTHLNNTNPVIREDSMERKLLIEEGIDIARDGQIIEL